MSKFKEVGFKINKDLKTLIIHSAEIAMDEDNLYITDEYYEGKNFEAENFGSDDQVFSYCGLCYIRVNNKSKLKKDRYFVSDDGHYFFSRHNDGDTVYIRYFEKEEKEKPRYIFGVGELKFPNEEYNKLINTLFKEDKEDVRAYQDEKLIMGECPKFSKIVDDIINEYLEEHGKYLSVPRAELNITTPDVESFKKKLEEAKKQEAKEKEEDLMIYNLGYNKRLIYSFKNDKLTCETTKKELYDRLLKFNGTSYDKLFDEEVVKIYLNEKIYRGISKDTINFAIELIDDFEDYIKFTDFGYNKIITFTDYLFWKL